MRQARARSRRRGRRSALISSSASPPWLLVYAFSAADEIRRVIGTAASDIHRTFRIRAERARAVHDVVRLVHRDQTLRRNALLHPALERRHRVERGGALAACRTRREEQPEELACLAVQIAVVVVAAVQETGHLVVVLEAACR